MLGQKHCDSQTLFLAIANHESSFLLDCRVNNSLCAFLESYGFLPNLKLCPTKWINEESHFWINRLSKDQLSCPRLEHFSICKRRKKLHWRRIWNQTSMRMSMSMEGGPTSIQSISQHVICFADQIIGIQLTFIIELYNSAYIIEISTQIEIKLRSSWSQSKSLPTYLFMWMRLGTIC